MSGRGEWWEVRQGMVMYTRAYSNPAMHVPNGIDWTVARMAIAGEADAVAAVIECPDDLRFQEALNAALKELE
jgi:hypothetical protein